MPPKVQIIGTYGPGNAHCSSPTQPAMWMRSMPTPDHAPLLRGAGGGGGRISTGSARGWLWLRDQQRPHHAQRRITVMLYQLGAVDRRGRTTIGLTGWCSRLANLVCSFSPWEKNNGKDQNPYSPNYTTPWPSSSPSSPSSSSSTPRSCSRPRTGRYCWISYPRSPATAGYTSGPPRGTDSVQRFHLPAANSLASSPSASQLPA